MLENSDQLPMVMKEDFEAIVCNRCGDCCESFWQPSSERLANMIALAEANKKTFEYYEDLSMIGWTAHDIQQYFINQKRLSWYKDIVPTGVSHPIKEGEEEWNNTQYRCTRFQRLNEFEGICTRHDERPDICENFPYGSPAGSYGFNRCSWRVQVV